MNATFTMIELTVMDLEASATWYCEQLDWARELTDTPRGFILLAHQDHPMKLALKRGETPSVGVLLHFLVPDLTAWLTAHGHHEASTKASDEGYRRAKIQDPDGHTIVVYEWLRR
ncbi:MAG: VOC family protein [Fimbriiglobus sp.]